MPIYVLSDAGKTRTYDKVEIDNLVGNGYSLIRANMPLRVVVSVNTGDWNADTTDPPVPAGETWYYADLTHNLGCEIARVVAGIGHDGMLIDGLIQMQRMESIVKQRIWLPFQPAYTTKWLVIG
jgi:hypothetical protein